MLVWWVVSIRRHAIRMHERWESEVWIWEIWIHLVGVRWHIGWVLAMVVETWLVVLAQVTVALWFFVIVRIQMFVNFIFGRFLLFFNRIFLFFVQNVVVSDILDKCSIVCSVSISIRLRN